MDNMVQQSPKRRERGMKMEDIKVLIVDDEPLVCELLKTELTDRGYQCKVCLNGKDALNDLRDHHCDVALLDIRLPDVSGMDILKEVHSNHPHVAPIMVTAISETATVVDALKLGALGYIVKPLDVDTVERRIRQALTTKQGPEDPHSLMNSLAKAVETRIDPGSTFAKVVLSETVELARRLRVSDEEIESWITAQNGKITESNSKLDRIETAAQTKRGIKKKQKPRERTG
jgi:DNA-binding response OmpR family regulator